MCALNLTAQEGLEFEFTMAPGQNEENLIDIDSR